VALGMFPRVWHITQREGAHRRDVPQDRTTSCTRLTSTPASAPSPPRACWPPSAAKARFPASSTASRASPRPWRSPRQPGWRRHREHDRDQPLQLRRLRFDGLQG
jgi:hypothetical protein